MLGFAPIDLFAISWFLLAWTLHSLFVDRRGDAGLTGKLSAYRRQWMREMVKRPNRIFDTQVNTSLQQGTAFFASTSLIAIGGSMSLFSATDQVIGILSMVPEIQPTRLQWQLKCLGLLLIFIYAFFKFSWAYRLFNYCAILMGATPSHEQADAPETVAMAERAAQMNIAAAGHFNRGQRALFFALGYLGWLVHPILLLLATTMVLIVVHRRQTSSDALEALR